MLSREEALRVKHAIDALTKADGESAAAWQALPALSRLADTDMDIEIDLRASAFVGAPVVVAHRHDTPVALRSRLTERQYEVALCLARGLSNKQIARELSISVATTKDHVHAVLSRLGVDSRGKAAAMVFANRE